MTRIVALLSWFDEQPSFLHDAIISLDKIGVDHLVAVDGAYDLFPHARNRSGLGQHEAILKACYGLHIGCTIHVPEAPWAENETEKRSFMFQLAEQITTPDDWYMVLDADEVVIEAPDDLKARLAHSIFDVANVTFREPTPFGTPRDYPIPILFRAIRGLHVTGNHFTYRTPDGRNLWGNAHAERLEPRTDLTDLKVLHRTQNRHADRKQAAKTYYDLRDELGIEANPCIVCGEPGVIGLPHNYRPVNGDPKNGAVADWVPACRPHAEEIKARNRADLAAMGLNPDAKTMIRPGPAPQPVPAA